MGVDEARQRILQGDIIRMGFADGGRVWWFENPYAEIDALTVKQAAVGHNGYRLLVEAGDCLFGWKGNSQTWVSVYA